MGFIRGLTGSDDARRAARDQVAAGDRSIDFMREELGINRARLEPFEQVGLDAAGDIASFGPEEQLAFAQGRTSGLGATETPVSGQAFQDIDRLRGFESNLDTSLSKADVVNNPLFKSLADDVQQRLFASQAAGGKFGSGETGVRLGERLLPLGLDIADRDFKRGLEAENAEFARRFDTAGLQSAEENQAFAQRLNKIRTESGLGTDQFNQLLALLQTGGNAAANSANMGTSVASSVGDIILDQGNATAAGRVAGGNNARALFGDALGAAALFFGG